MKKYWVIAPFENSPEFNRVWTHDLDNGFISIGWESIGPIEGMSYDDLLKKVSSTYPSYKPINITKVTNTIWRFHNEIEPGDIIIARRGRNVIAGVGEVLEKAIYDSNKKAPGVNYDHNRFIKVKWSEENLNIDFQIMVFGMQTLYQIIEDQFNALINRDNKTKQFQIDAIAEESFGAFQLEKYLEQFIVDNFSKVFGGKFRLYIDEVDKVVGQQYNTEIGIIDILAQDVTSGDFVVIELKRGQASDVVIGQTLRYMGWVSENLATEQQKVSGIVICHEPDKRLEYASKMTPNINVKYYQVSFSLRDSY